VPALPLVASTTARWRAPAGSTFFDVWESQEAFEAFGATLLPILSAAGVDPGAPMITEAHNVIPG
jgi:hypothetical protein